MKLYAPTGYTGSSVRGADGLEYAVVDGVVNMPSESLHDSLFGQGFHAESNSGAPAPTIEEPEHPPEE